MRISILAGTNEYSGRLADMIRSFASDASITMWNDPADMVCLAEHVRSDLVFVAVDKSGAAVQLEAASQISDKMPGCAIVLIAQDCTYAIDALRIHAQGYLVEPVSTEDLRTEYEYYLKRQGALAEENGMPADDSETSCRISFRTDGGFDCLKDGVPVQFNRSKTRDLIEYLAEKHGAMATDAELLMKLWGKENSSTKSALRSTKAEIVNLFRDAGCEDAIVKHRGRIGIMMDKIS